MNFSHWMICKPGRNGRVHPRLPADWRYLCGRYAEKGHQRVMNVAKLRICTTCARVKRIAEKRGYR